MSRLTNKPLTVAEMSHTWVPQIYLELYIARRAYTPSYNITKKVGPLQHHLPYSCLIISTVAVGGGYSGIYITLYN